MLAPSSVRGTVSSALGIRRKGDKGLSGPSQGSVGGTEPLKGPVGVQEAAPVLPWLYLGQAALGTALKCEAASLGVAGGVKSGLTIS